MGEEDAAQDRQGPGAHGLAANPPEGGAVNPTGESPTVPRVLFIIAWDDLSLYQQVRAEFADMESVSVIRDRRRRDRRHQTVQVSEERRRDERRTRDVSRVLHDLGWVLVPKSIS